LSYVSIVFADPDQEPQEVPPNEGMPGERVLVGGEFNRWLNITRTEIVQGAEDPDSRIYICEVCEGNSTRDNCIAANYTQVTVGTPPDITDASSEYLFGLTTGGWLHPASNIGLEWKGHS
jgi:hypothetical protein